MDFLSLNVFYLNQKHTLKQVHEIDLQFWTPCSEATGNKAIT